MAQAAAIVWTEEMDALVGMVSDATVATRLGLREDRVRYRRRRLNIPPWRASRGEVAMPCAGCGKAMMRKSRDVRRSNRLTCSKACAASVQKRRDSDSLRYGPGWKNRRSEIRRRDKVCRACGKTPKQTGAALHVHHLKPYRLGGTNHPTNLVALCEGCHHVAEAVTSTACDSIPLAVDLDGSCLTIRLGDETLWRGSVAGAVSPIPTGSPP